MKRFTIQRSKWGRAPKGGTECGMLYNPRTGKMCCLGFWCEQIAGLRREKISSASKPKELLEGDLSSDQNQILRSIRPDELIRLNDRALGIHSEPEEQERLIAEEFARQGYEVVFED